MQKKRSFLVLLIYACMLPVIGIAKTVNFFPSLHHVLYPNFCLEHTMRFPQECSPYGTSWIESEILSILSDDVTRMPTLNQECDFHFCPGCRTPVLRKTIYQQYEDEDGDPVFELGYTCDCLDAWYYLNRLESHSEAQRICRRWTKCYHPSVPYGYFNKHARQSIDYLKQHLTYTAENPDCTCYWPYLSKDSCSISDTVYDRIYSLLINTVLGEVRYEENNANDFPDLGHRSLHGVTYNLFLHSFFYSQYREVLLKLAMWEEHYDPDTESVVAILNELYSILDTLQPQFLNLYSECLKAHPHPKIYYEKGMVLFHQGSVLEALDDIQQMIHLAKNKNLPELLTSDLYLKEGESYAELGLYDKAVESLTTAIQKNPQNNKAYMERAAAYFELGNWDLSFTDYIKSGIKPSPLQGYEGLAFSLELTKGILGGGAQSGKDILSSLRGLGSGLWAFAKDPIHLSGEFIYTLQACVLFIRDHTPQDLFSELVPELQELITHWDTLEPSIRGNKTGYIIGKYGIEIFAGSGIAKGVALYRNLKQANHILNFEALALSKRNQTLLKVEAANRIQAKKEIFKKANLQIQKDKQGKHLLGHKYYNPSLNKSIWTHPAPEKLVQKYAGTGVARGNQMPGTAGYIEIVNFEEFIGYEVDQFTGTKTATTWGKIHYAQDGVHLVPTRPLR